MNFEMYEKRMRSDYAGLAETIGAVLTAAIEAHPSLRLQQIKHRAKDPESLKKKLEEDGFSSDLSKYRFNLGRTDKEIEEMKGRVKDELFPILTIDEQKKFDMQKTLDELNKVFAKI